jgi:hypothetical protein
MTNYWRVLLPNERANFPHQIKSYGSLLRSNKALLLQAFAASNIPQERRVLMMAMAMIETATLSPSDRDKGKDNLTDGSANASIFNLNEEMLRRLNYSGNIHLLDPLSALPRVVTLINDAINNTNWGITPNRGVPASGVTAMLNWVRGGSSTYKDGVSWDAANYRNAVATAVKLISDDPSLMSDDRRIEMIVRHQK